MNTNKILSMAVMLVIGSAATMQQANATEFSMTSPIKVALETADVGSTGELGIAASDTFAVPVTTGVNVSSTAPYYVQVTLTGGATFANGSLAANMTLSCGYGAAGAKPAIEDAPAVIIGGTIASFKLESGALGSTGCKLVWTNAGKAFILTSGNKEYGISVLSRSTEPSAPFSNTRAGTLVTFAQGLTVGTSGGTVVVNVVSPTLSKGFVNDGSVSIVGVATAVANLGRIMYTPDASVRTLAGGAVAHDSYLKTATLIVSGVPIAAAVSATSGSTTVTGGIYLSSTASCTAAIKIEVADSANIANADYTKQASGTQVSFSVDAIAFGGNAAPGIHVCMLPNGITNIDRGTVSYQLTLKAAQGIGTPNLSAVDPTLVTVSKNGASIKVLNISYPQHPTDMTYIRLYNMGTTTGRVRGTLYDQNGAVLGTANSVLVDAIAPNVVSVISSTTLATIVGVSTWPGKAWLQIEGEVQGLRVQAIAATSYGSIDVGSRVKADGEQLCRSEEDTCRNP